MGLVVLMILKSSEGFGDQVKTKVVILWTNVTSFIKPLYGMSFVLVLYGLLSPMLTDRILDKILVSPGFVLAIIVSNVARLVKNSDDKERKRTLEIISLGLSVIAVLFMLWLLGDEMFDLLQAGFSYVNSSGYAVRYTPATHIITTQYMY